MKMDNTYDNDGLVERVLRRLPGGGFAQDQLDRIERRLLSLLKQRLDRVERTPASFRLTGPTIVVGKETELPGQILRGLLDHAQEQRRDEAEAAWYAAVLRTLVPDQARILAALSDGSAYPLIQVLSGSLLGGVSYLELGYVSNVGKNAGTQCPELTPGYVQHLHQLGLVEIGVDEMEETVKYELLETDTDVRVTLERIKSQGRRSRVVRRTLRLSALGMRLWAACRVAED